MFVIPNTERIYFCIKIKYLYNSVIPNALHTAVTPATPIRNEILKFVSLFGVPVVTECSLVTQPSPNRISIIRKDQIKKQFSWTSLTFEVLM